MKRNSWLIASLLPLVAGAALSAPHRARPAHLTDVRVCPMTGESVVGAGAGSEVVGRYRVHFCCLGCQPNFDKLTAKQKQGKVAAALKKAGHRSS